MFEKLILEITKVNIYLLVIYTIQMNEMHCSECVPTTKYVVESTPMLVRFVSLR